MALVATTADKQQLLSQDKNVMYGERKSLSDFVQLRTTETRKTTCWKSRGEVRAPVQYS